MPKTQIATSEHLPEWLHARRVSLAATTYQTHRLFLVGVKDDGSLSGFERLYDRPMGLCAEPDAGAIHFAERYQIRTLVGALSTAQREAGDRHGIESGGYDQVYVPRTTRITGELDAHEIGRLGPGHAHAGRLVFVNTKYSCLAMPSDTHSFEVLWTPPFISKLAAEDRCHLNGLAMEDGHPRYVTAASRSDVAAGWRARRESGGVVIDVDSGEIVCTGLSMPHSPRLVRGRLWLVNAGTGELGTVDLDTGRFEPVAFLPGFGRGLATWDGLGIVGLSKPRRNRAFEGLELDKRLEQKDADARCGLWFVDLDTGVVAHWLEFTSVVEELFDVAVLPGVRRPMALGFKTNEIQRFITFPDPSAAPEADGSARVVRHQIALKDEVQAEQHGEGAVADGPLPLFERPKPRAEARAQRRPASAPRVTLDVGQLSLGEALERFEPLVTDTLRRAIRSGRRETSARVAVVVASSGARPVGLALARRGEGRIGEVLSLRVEAAWRGRGLGTALVERMERVAGAAGASAIQASYRSDLGTVTALERVFAKRGWGAPRTVRQHVKGPAAITAEAEPWRSATAPARAELFPWAERTAQDDEEVAAMLRSGSVPRSVYPHQLPDRTDPDVSVGARVDGRLAAWLVCHRLGPRLVQYTALYVPVRALRAGLGAVHLIAEAFRRQVRYSDAPDFIYAAEAGNGIMERMAPEHPDGPRVMKITDVRLIGKRL